jgi:hypothetical protein
MMMQLMLFEKRSIYSTKPCDDNTKYILRLLFVSPFIRPTFRLSFHDGGTPFESLLGPPDEHFPHRM